MMGKPKTMARALIDPPAYIPTKLTTTKKGLQQEAAILRERVKALEEALFDALSGLRYVRANYPEVSGVGFDRCEGYQSLIGADTR